MQGILPRPEIAEVMQRDFVMVAVDADDPETEAIALAHNIPDAMMLPLLVFADAEGTFLHGTSGGHTPESFRAALAQA